MNNFITNFAQILHFARDQGLPLTKKRGILREALQAKFLVELYALPQASRLAFVGGTALRLLYRLNRFSEDLDFDNLGLSDPQIKALIDQVVARFRQENFDLELTTRPGPEKIFFEIKFPHLLNDLKISTNPREKLLIKFDYSNLWHGQQTRPVLLNHYGFLQTLITNPLNHFLVQKLTAYSRRSETQPRDLYDIVWLYSQQAHLDEPFLKANHLTDLIAKARGRFAKEGLPAIFFSRLRPFLFNEADVAKLRLFGPVLAALRP